jgi:hypothetical protein
MRGRILLALLAPALSAMPARAQSFADDVAFLRRHTSVVVLAPKRGGARVAVCPELQGRVMTSGARGDEGPGFGWINRELIASGRRAPQMNAYGGEDRFWLGPEGGQFALFFEKGDPFDLAHWQTPAPIDSEPYEVSARGPDRVSFVKRMRLVNYSGTPFEIELQRTLRLLDAREIAAALGQKTPPDKDVVGYESENRITNVGRIPWRKETGLVSIWILGMFKPTPRTTVVVPFEPGDESERGPVVNDAYFGKVPEDRLVRGERVLFFKGDGRHRSKIGLGLRRAKPVVGSYDAGAGVLTIVRYDLPRDARDYVNSMWELQKDPFGGDVVNSYNDGPPAPGAKPLGPFYELETSSPAAALAPGESLVHRHSTLHLAGDAKAVDPVARAVLGVSLAQIRAAFGSAGAAGPAPRRPDR